MNSLSDFIQHTQCSLSPSYRLAMLSLPLHQGAILLLEQHFGHEQERSILLCGNGSEVSESDRVLLSHFAGFQIWVSEPRHAVWQLAAALRKSQELQICAGEVDFLSLRALEDEAKERAKRHGVRIEVLRCGIYRDVDGIPIGPNTEAMEPELRFSARYIPQALRLSARMFRENEAVSEQSIIELTRENLEKSQGLCIESLEIVPDPDYSEKRLCLRAAAGRIKICDNVRLVRESKE